MTGVPLKGYCKWNVRFHPCVAWAWTLSSERDGLETMYWAFSDQSRYGSFHQLVQFSYAKTGTIGPGWSAIDIKEFYKIGP